MGLNIKNEKTCLLARELARLTGETMTGAITIALRERLAREKRQRGLDARIEALLPSAGAAHGCVIPANTAGTLRRAW